MLGNGFHHRLQLEKLAFFQLKYPRRSDPSNHNTINSLFNRQNLPGLESRFYCFGPVLLSMGIEVLGTVRYGQQTRLAPEL